MDRVLIEKARKFVESEIKKPTSNVPVDFIYDHLIPMEKHSKKLSNMLGGDKEIISLAVWLHDVGSIIYRRNDHHITSARIAQKFLEQEKYDSEKLKIVLDCIRHHRQSTNFKRTTIEEKIIADADAISNFDMLPGAFYATLVVAKMTPIEAAKSVKKKLESKWRRLHFKESKELVRPKYNAAMLLLAEITKL